MRGLSQTAQPGGRAEVVVFGAVVFGAAVFGAAVFGAVVFGAVRAGEVAFGVVAGPVVGADEGVERPAVPAAVVPVAVIFQMITTFPAPSRMLNVPEVATVSKASTAAVLAPGDSTIQSTAFATARGVEGSVSPAVGMNTKVSPRTCPAVPTTSGDTSNATSASR